MDGATVLASILSGGATGAVISALWNHFSQLWLQRDEASLNAKLATLENEFQKSQRKAQAEIDRFVFVTRAHFETEFEAMKQVFNRLSEVRLAINGLRPMMSIEPLDESDQERLKRLSERLEILSHAYNKLIAESEARAPFYTADLYYAVDMCLRAASAEIASVRTAGNDTFSFDWFREGDKNRNNFAKGYQEAVENIRDRISKLAVLPTR